jgi:hypothetical protein
VQRGDAQSKKYFVHETHLSTAITFNRLKNAGTLAGEPYYYAKHLFYRQ